MPGRDTQGFLLRAGLAGLAAGLSGWPGREGRREGLSWINGSTVGHHYSLIYQCIYIYASYVCKYMYYIYIYIFNVNIV